VLIMSDEHNLSFSSVYGHSFVLTPSMQRLADESVAIRNGNSVIQCAAERYAMAMDGP